MQTPDLCYFLPIVLPVFQSDIASYGLMQAGIMSHGPVHAGLTCLLQTVPPFQQYLQVTSTWM